MDKIMEYLPIVLQGLGALVILATVVVRFTPSKVDDENINKIAKAFLKMLRFLPTIGINPQTKKLEDQIEELQKK